MEAYVARVDQLAWHVFEQWGDEATPSFASEDLLEQLQNELADAGPGGDEEIRHTCPRMRLLALTCKILRLLSSCKGQKLYSVVQTWAGSVKQPQSQAGYEKLIIEMRNIRDVANVLDKASGASSHSILKEVVDAAKHLNSVLSRLSAQEKSKASRGHGQSTSMTTSALAAGSRHADRSPDAMVPLNARDKRPMSPQTSASLLKRTRPNADIPRDGLPVSLAAPIVGGGGSSSSSSRAPAAAPAPEAGLLPSDQSQPLIVDESPDLVELPPPVPREYDIFFAPVLDEAAAPVRVQPQGQAQRTARSSPPGDADESMAFGGDVPGRQRHYLAWTPQEEDRLRAGFQKYGKSWETIRTTQGLKHRTGSQIRDKWRSLGKLP